MKDWLYDNRSIEVVVHKWMDHPILRFSVHAHTSVEDILALERGVRDYFQSFKPTISSKEGKAKL